jgi:hypothetical protein
MIINKCKYIYIEKLLKLYTFLHNIRSGDTDRWSEILIGILCIKKY